MQRFTGSVQECAQVNAHSVARWIAAIPFEAWPQQHREGICPAMVNDLGWHGFGKMTKEIIRQAKPPGTEAYEPLLSVVMPGHAIPPHTDQQAPYWLARVHVPLATNPKSEFIVDGKTHCMQVGRAYLVNILREHAVNNHGKTARIHLFFDIK